MAKFCKECGTRLDEATGLCPKCNPNAVTSQEQNEKPEAKRSAAAQEQNTESISKKSAGGQLPSKKEKKAQIKRENKRIEQEKKREKRAAMSRGQKVRRFFLKLLLIVLLFGILAGGTTAALVYFDVVDIPFVETLLVSMGLKEREALPHQGQDPSNDHGDLPQASGTFEVTPPDADSYFEDNATILSKIDANDSTTVTTEAETCDTLAERGLDEYPITTEYSMTGDYSEATEISQGSSTKHPTYQTYYVSKNGDVWTIFMINGAIMANPVSYNIQSDLDAQVILSESNTVMSYDGTTNRFYETIPNKSSLIVKTVDRIDAETLENLTIGAIDER